MLSDRHLRTHDLPTVRIEMLTDGVFAIAMTILVLELHVPEAVEPGHLGEALAELAPKLFTYALSFLVLGVYWVGHHNTFVALARADRNFLWINILFLMLISFVPFTTAVLGTYAHEQVAVVIYGAHLIAIGLVLLLQWTYAAGRGALVREDVTPERIQAVKQRILTAPVAASFAIAASFVSPYLSFAIYTLLLAIAILSGLLERFLPTRDR